MADHISYIGVATYFCLVCCLGRAKTLSAVMGRCRAAPVCVVVRCLSTGACTAVDNRPAVAIGEIGC